MKTDVVGAAATLQTAGGPATIYRLRTLPHRVRGHRPPRLADGGRLLPERGMLHAALRKMLAP